MSKFVNINANLKEESVVNAVEEFKQVIRSRQGQIDGENDVDLSNVEVRDMNNVGFMDGDRFVIIAGTLSTSPVNGGRPAPLCGVLMAEQTVRECYLSMFTRSVVPYEEVDGKPVRQGDADSAKGTFVSDWKKSRFAKTSMANVLEIQEKTGYSIVAHNRRVVRTYGPVTRDNKTVRDFRDQVVYDFDWADENGNLVTSEGTVVAKDGEWQLTTYKQKESGGKSSLSNCLW